MPSNKPQLLFYAPSSARADSLLASLSSEYQIFCLTASTELEGVAFDEANAMILAFPSLAELETLDSEQILQAVLSFSFSVVQQFVQARMRKKSGTILFLLDSRANGLEHQDEAALHSRQARIFYAAQGALIGFCKTLSKEYGKRGILSNTLYVDWERVSDQGLLSDLASFLPKDTGEASAIQGQVVAVDGGRWL